MTPTPLDLDKCPQCNGPADNGHDRELPPNVYLCSRCQSLDLIKKLRVIAKHRLNDNISLGSQLDDAISTLHLIVEKIIAVHHLSPEPA